MFEEWFNSRVKDILAQADPLVSKDLDKLAQIGKTLIDYLMLQLNGVSINTQPVKKAEPVLPADFRG